MNMWIEKVQNLILFRYNMGVTNNTKT